MIDVMRRWRSLEACVFLGLSPVAVQSQAAGPFAPGGQQLVLLDFSKFPLGSVPVSTRPGQCLPSLPVCDIKGDLEVVMQNGVPMLRAAGRSSFVIRLSQRLPNDFTLEFDLIPKTCCQPEDLSFEGVADIAYGQSAVSANVLWHHNAHAIIGGIASGGFSMPMPGKLAAEVMGSLANVTVNFRGTSLTMYTNGTQVYSVQREFVRGSVLRVFLGGQNDTDRAVYLARLRIGTGAPVVASAPLMPTQPGIATVGVPTTGTSAVPGASVPQPVLANAGAVASGPVAAGNPAAAATAAALAAPAHRTVPLNVLTAAGVRMVPRVLVLPTLAAAGVSIVVPPHQVRLNPYIGSGAAVVVGQRSIRLPGVSARGAWSSSGSLTLSPQTIALPPIAALGALGTLTPRSIAVPGITAIGPVSSMAPRMIRLTAVTAGGASSVPPRTIRLPAISASGSTKIP
jgi:hypothetical protein